MITTRSGIADILGINLSTVDSRIRRGMPAKERKQKNSPWEFDTAEVIQWTIDQALENYIPPAGKASNPNDSASELRRRKAEAETSISEIDLEKKQIELAEKKGELVHIDDANAEIINAVTTLRQRLLTVPRRLTPLVLGETDDRIMKDLIEKEIKDALDDLSRSFESESEASEDETP